MPQTKICFLQDLSLKDKTVFMRVDFNVPIENGVLLDSYRIDKAYPSIKHILEQGGRLVLASHLGRPDGQHQESLSLRPVAEYLTSKYNLEVLLMNEPDVRIPKHLLRSLKSPQVILLENLRFHPGELACDHQFAKILASYTDVYINEGFSISHRKHASTVSLPEMISDKAAGLQCQTEMQHLDNIRLQTTKTPFFVFLGGSKVEDKILLLENLIDQTDAFFIGGLMAYSFLKAQGIDVGDTYVNPDHLPILEKFMARLQARGKRIWLPIDHVIAKGDKVKITKGSSIDHGYQGMDIGPQTRKLFGEKLQRAQSIFWNGPMGYFEKEQFSAGSKQLAEDLAKHQSAYRVIGGGHSALAVRDYETQLDHVSTGGGASLAYIQNKVLPGLQSLTVKVPEVSEDSEFLDLSDEYPEYTD